MNSRHALSNAINLSLCRIRGWHLFFTTVALLTTRVVVEKYNQILQFSSERVSDVISATKDGFHWVDTWAAMPQGDTRAPTQALSSVRTHTFDLLYTVLLIL